MHDILYNICNIGYYIFHANSLYWIEFCSRLFLESSNILCSIEFICMSQKIFVNYCSCFVFVVILQEWGGYFIVNGIEKILRMLILQRRNYVSFLNFI